MKRKNKPIILIMAGGTGGHIFPGIALANTLKKQGFLVHWLGTPSGMEKAIVQKDGYPFHAVSASRLRGISFLRLLKMPFKLLVSLIQAIQVIRKIRPVAVISLGGYASGMGGVATYLLRFPLILHEQNAVLGLTNRYLSALAQLRLSGFPQAFTKRASIVTGNPVRQKLLNLPEPTARWSERAANYSAYSSPRPLHLLVLGGSQGASIFNELLPSVLAEVSHNNCTVYVCHIAGNGLEKTRSLYQAAGFPLDTEESIRLMDFCEDMASVYSWADWVICRSGAMTVSELSAVGLGSLLVPFPYAVDDHQTMNARYLVEGGAGILMQQNTLNKDGLINKLLYFHSNPDKLLSMAIAARLLGKPYATEKVAKHVAELIQQN